MAALIVALVYGVSLSILPANVFWMPDEGAKLFELESCSLSWQDGVTYRIPFAGQRLLPGNEFLPGFDVFPEPMIASDGKLYLGFDNPVVFPLATAPFYRAFGPLGLYVLPVVSGWLVAVLSGALAACFSSRLAPIAILLVGLGTPVWFYSVVFWEHTLATLFAMVAVYVLVRSPHRLESLAAVIPAMIAASMLRAEMPALAVALVAAWAVVAVDAWRRPDVSGAPRLHLPVGGWRLLALSLAAAVVLAALLRYSSTGRHKALLRVLPERIPQVLSGFANLPQGLFEVFINSQSLGPVVSAGWGAAAAAAALLALSAPFLRSPRARAVCAVIAMALMLPCSLALIVTGEPYRGLHGLLPVAPFVILWPFALSGAWRRHDARILTLAVATGAYLALCFGALALTYVRQGVLDVGMQWGQRYMLTAYPMLTVLALVGLRGLRRSWSATGRAVLVSLFVLLVASGIALEVRGVRMLYGTRGIMAKWDHAMRAEGQPIVTTVWWIVPAVAELFLTHDMFFTWRPGVAHWVERARQAGVTRFTLAHTEPISDEALNAPGLERESDGTRMITGGLLLTRFRIGPVPTP